MPPLRVSVIIRTKNEARDLDGVLEALESQSLGRDAVETIVVDSGSTDGTVAIAKAHRTHLIEIPTETFTYGRALNIGCEAASAPILLALSGHAYPPDDGWLDRMLEPFEDERVACATGNQYGPTGRPMTGRVLQDVELALRHPLWGYANVAGAFRAELWRQRPFREDMPFTEDKEWAWHWLHEGWLVALDPALDVAHDHSRDSVLVSYQRARAAFRGYSMFLDVPPLGPHDLMATALSRRPLRAWLQPAKWAGVLGQYVERRRPSRQNGRRARRARRSSML